MGLSLWRKTQFIACQYAEPRALFELQSFYLFRRLLKKLPSGDGHSVVVFPGFGGSDRSTIPLRNLLDDLGYDTYGWGLGANILYDEALEDEMVAMVREVAANSGRTVSLIGWSLGGIFAREIAKNCTESVRCVITLGSPVSGQLNTHTNASKLFEFFNGEPSAIQQDKFRRLPAPPQVPTTSIYSKTDGIVAWEASVQKEYSGKQVSQTENIEVPASHLGIGVNPFSMIAIADRLSQVEGNWQEFNPKWYEKLIFKRPSTRLTRSSKRSS